MKRTSTAFLQIVVVLIGMGVLALMLWEPHIEGRTVHATLFEIYFKDPFLAYAYVTSIAFFVALYQTLKLLRCIGRDEVFSEASVRALRIIKYCAIAIAASIGGAVAYLFIARPGDDIAGGVAMGLVLTFISVVVATAAAVFERLLQNAVDMKSENDLTV